MSDRAAGDRRGRHKAHRRQSPAGSDGLTDTERAEYAARYQAVVNAPIPKEMLRQAEHEVLEGKRPVLRLRRAR
jgi:hypothetical protein